MKRKNFFGRYELHIEENSVIFLRVIFCRTMLGNAWVTKLTDYFLSLDCLFEDS